MLGPPAWINSTTPSYATVLTGNIGQTEDFTTVGTVPRTIGFLNESSWSDRTSWTATDPSGIVWMCNTEGIYNLRATQNLVITAPAAADADIIVIPNTTFFLDVAGNLPAPRIGTALLHPITTTQTTITLSSEAIESDILMGTFTTSPGFLTSLATAGGVWTLSLFASTTNTEEANSAYISVYTVDADGVSNPVLVLNGASGTPFIINGIDLYNYITTFTVPTFIVDDLTKRVQFRIYANFSTDVPSSIFLYFRDTTLPSVQTTISQDILPTVRDVVNMRLSVVSETTTEFNQVIQTSIPVAMGPGEVIAINNAVSGYIRADEGAIMYLEVVSVQGNIGIVSGFTILPSPNSVLGWNLIAQGPYGNAGVIV